MLQCNQLCTKILDRAWIIYWNNCFLVSAPVFLVSTRIHILRTIGNMHAQNLLENVVFSLFLPKFELLVSCVGRCWWVSLTWCMLLLPCWKLVWMQLPKEEDDRAMGRCAQACVYIVGWTAGLFRAQLLMVAAAKATGMVPSGNRGAMCLVWDYSSYLL